jgi:CHAT domain-containing protein
MSLPLLRVPTSRWPLATLVITTPLVLGGWFWWATETRPRTAAIALGPTIVSKPPSVETPAAIDTDLSLDRQDQIRNLREQIRDLRAAAVPDPTALGRALLQLGRLQCAEGNDEAAATFREISTLDGDAAHWQIAEAAIRLAALEKMASAHSAERLVWQEGYDRQLQAEALHAAGHYREAITRAEEALAARRRLWGTDHAETAESLTRLAWLATEHADYYQQAQGLAHKALDLAQTAWCEVHPYCGDCLFVLATLADARGEFIDADRLYEQAQDLYRRSVGESSREYARALSRQGRMHNVWWKDFGAGKSYTALAIRERILDKEHPDCAESHEDAAEVQYGLLQYDRAEAQLERALEIRRRRQGTDHPNLARAFGLLAACHAEQGKLSQALVNIRRALSLTEKWRGARHPSMAEQQILLGKVGIRSNDYAVGCRALKKARETLSELGLQKHPWYCEAIFQQAENLRCDATHHLDEKNDAGMSAARPVMEEAVDAYRTLPVPEAERIGYFADALLSLAETYYYLNYPDQTRKSSASLIQEAEKVVHFNGGKMHPLYYFVPIAQGHYCAARGHYHQALPLYAEGAERLQKQVGAAAPWLQADALQALNGGHVHQGTNLKKARDYGLEAFHIFNDIYHGNAAGQSDSSRLAAMEDCFGQLSMNLSIGDLLHDQASLYDLVLAVRGAATSFQTSHRLVHDHPELKPLLQRIIEERHVLKERVFSDDAAESQDDWVERVLDASEHKENAECELAIAIRRFVSEEAPLTWRDVQSVLDDDMAFIDFLQYIHHSSPEGHKGRLNRDRRMLAYLVTKKSRSPLCIPLGRSTRIEEAVTAWRQATSNFRKGPAGSIEAATGDLASLVWTPVLEQMPADVKHLYIAPDGPLCFVSFAAMPGRSPGAYALEDYRISYVNSGRWLYQLRHDPAHVTGEGILLCGGINYHPLAPLRGGDKPRAINRKPLLPDPAKIHNLPATEIEIDEVAELFPKKWSAGREAVKVSGRGARAGAFEAELSRHWRCVHFAGHGFFIDPDKARALAGHIEALGQSTYFVQRNQLLLSSLVLAPDRSGSAGPTILTAEEVGSLDLRGTDLVVLSACETGLGCTAGSDGVIGLTRAFLTAGSRSVVSSLWKVDDAATSFLMQEFYRNLWERRYSSKSEALRQAQLTVLRSPAHVSERAQELALRALERGLELGVEDLVEPIGSDTDHCHPALWAAFVLNGDER